MGYAGKGTDDLIWAEALYLRLARIRAVLGLAGLDRGGACVCFLCRCSVYRRVVCMGVGGVSSVVLWLWSCIWRRFGFICSLFVCVFVFVFGVFIFIIADPHTHTHLRCVWVYGPAPDSPVRFVLL